jgi:FAD binding domain
MIKDVIIRYCAVIAGCTRGKIADLSARRVSENAPPDIILELHLMKKRTFIKLFAAALASPPVMRLLAWARQEKLRNWAGNIEYSTDRLQTSTSLAQVQDYVKTQPKLKVLGTRHCFNNIADSKDGFLSLKPMDEVISLDPAKRTVTVAAGITYGQLCPHLDGKGFALHNLASLPHISVAGACSTATHGSGLKNGNLATAASGLEIVTADGTVVNLSRERDGETFNGAVVGLGALGVITKVTLDIQPSFIMRQYVYENLPLGELKEHFDAIESSGYSVSLFTDWQKQRINELWIKSRIEEGQEFHASPEFIGRSSLPATCTRLRHCRRKTAPSRWAFPVRGMSACRTFAWAHAQRRQRVAIGILRATAACGGSNLGGREAARPSESVSLNYRNPHHRQRPFMVESLLQARLRNHPLHLETRLACRQQTVAGHREGTRSIQRAPTLGKAIHNFVDGTQEYLQEDARIRRTEQALRSARQVSQRVPEPEHLRYLAWPMIIAAACLLLSWGVRRKTGSRNAEVDTDWAAYGTLCL